MRRLEQLFAISFHCNYYKLLIIWYYNFVFILTCKATAIRMLYYLFVIIHTYLAQTPEIGQGLGRFLSCGARKQEQT